MSSAVNGMACHGGLIPYASTFFVFSDYCKPAIRIGAIMGVHSLFVFTHDSIGVGEDGPTHEPVEQLTALRVLPHITDFHPADANETAAVWKLALELKGPSFMALSRQNLPVLDPTAHDIAGGVAKGAYVVEEAVNPQVVLIGSGSELWPVLEAAKLLKAEGIAARVVSFPSWKLFDAQTAEYKAGVLPASVPKLAVEAGSTQGWWKYTGLDGDVIGMERFGISAPGPIVMKELGFSAENIAARAKKLIK
jgi:transketolase